MEPQDQKRITRRAILKLASATGLALGPLASACQPQSGGPATSGAAAVSSASARKELVWGTPVSFTRMIPQYTGNGIDNEIYDCLYETLVHVAPDGSFSKNVGIATEWKHLSDTTWQFKLRPGIKFHNGDPLTAADVKFTLERHLDPAAKTIGLTYLPALKSVDVVDDLTVNINTSSADPLMPKRLSYYGSYIMPAKYFKQVGDDAFEQKPIGSGPFKFVELVKDQRLVLEANKDYWGGAPNIDRLTVKPIPDTSARMTALIETSEVDISDKVPFDYVERLRNNPKTQALDAEIPSMYSMLVNVKAAPLDNKLVRQALSLAIDRQALVKNLLLGRGVPANSMIPRGDFAYDQSLPPLPYDPARARNLLRDAGYRGQEILFENGRNLSLANEQDVGEALVAMWKDVGLTVKLEFIDIATYNQKSASLSFRGLNCINLASGSLRDPGYLMWRALAPGGRYNYGIDNPEFMRLGSEAASSFDDSVRLRDFRRMTEILNDQAYAIPLFQILHAYGVKRDVHFTPGPGFIVNFRRDNLKVGG